MNLVVCLLLFLFAPFLSFENYGCLLEDDVCDSDELCLQDVVVGRCVNAAIFLNEPQSVRSQLEESQPKRFDPHTFAVMDIVFPFTQLPSPINSFYVHCFLRGSLLYPGYTQKAIQEICSQKLLHEEKQTKLKEPNSLPTAEGILTKKHPQKIKIKRQKAEKAEVDLGGADLEGGFRYGNLKKLDKIFIGFSSRCSKDELSFALPENFKTTVGEVADIINNDKAFTNNLGIHINYVSFSNKNGATLSLFSTIYFAVSFIFCIIVIACLFFFINRKFKTKEKLLNSNEIEQMEETQKGELHRDVYTIKCKKEDLELMDVSTGHLVLTYMERHLNSPDLIKNEWQELEVYGREVLEQESIETAKQNEHLNRNANNIPFDSNRVVLTYPQPKLKRENEVKEMYVPTSNSKRDRSIKFFNDGKSQGSYINASYIYDSDPHIPSYIAAETPSDVTCLLFWQMIWENEVTVLVLLARLQSEVGSVFCKYWPNEGVDVYGVYEVHLVSEHMWCEDYIVRSFYIKNSDSHHTRTLTQFHFLSWPDHEVPSPKSLLDFKRKVNKSFRMKDAPILVTCDDGCGKTGLYILIDIVFSRLIKGVKEIDLSATLEFLRDQRMHFIETQEQYEFAFVAIAEEVNNILKNLPQ